MKISFILPGSGRSGGIKSTVKAANGLIQRGHQVRLLVHKGYETTWDWLRDVYISVRYPGSNDWLYLFEGKVERFKRIEQCRFEDNEIVIASCWWASGEIRRLQNPRIIKVHHMRGIPNSPERTRLYFGENIPKIGVGSFINDPLEQACGQRILAVIPNGIDTTEYYPSLPEEQRDGIGTIYGHNWYKDPDTIIAFLDRMRTDRPDVPQYIFSANRRPKAIPRLIYHRLPSLERIRDLYSRSLVWVLASRSEGFPAPVLEAMCCGCAVVATDCGGPRDIITDGENGFLVETCNVNQIVDRVKLLLDDQTLRKRFVEESRKTVAKFTWDNSVKKLEEVLASLSSNKGGKTKDQPSV